MALSEIPKHAAGLDTSDSSSGDVAPRALDRSCRLASLLDAHPVDLARVSKEIHADPKLETLVMMLTAILNLPADSFANTLEEATVILGTERLRAIAYVWSLLPQTAESAILRGRIPLRAPNGTISDATSNRPSDEWTRDLLYAASFLRWLGIDSPAQAASSEPPSVDAGSSAGR